MPKYPSGGAAARVVGCDEDPALPGTAISLVNSERPKLAKLRGSQSPQRDAGASILRYGLPSTRSPTLMKFVDDSSTPALDSVLYRRTIYRETI